MKILDLGCGLRKYVGGSRDVVIGLDRVKTPAADVVFDIDSRRPLPFPPDSFDLVYANHVFEHIADVMFLLEEAHRILKPGGKLVINTPHFSSSDFYIDPTHKHPFASQSFDYFDPSTHLGSSFGFYSKAKFRILEKRIVFGWLPYALLFGLLANRFRGFYESKLAFIFPAASLHFEMVPLKKRKRAYLTSSFEKPLKK